MKPVFQFRDGCHLHGDAQAVGERLESIRAKQHALTAEIVLKDARNIRSVLHSFFEWDDAKAAELHRLQQAGHLIRSIAVTFEDAEPQPQQQVSIAGIPVVIPVVRAVRAFLPIRDNDGESSYVGTQQAMTDPEMRKQVLSRAHAELDSVGRKYRELRELSDVFMALDRVAEQLQSSEGQPS